jgi:hypothetical protein
MSTPSGTTDATERHSDEHAGDTRVQLPFPGRDVRRKRPPALSFLLRMDTLRRVARLVLLLGLDFAGVFLAIFTALSL